MYARVEKQRTGAFFREIFLYLCNVKNFLGKRHNSKFAFLSFITKKSKHKLKIVSLIDTNAFLWYYYINIIMLSLCALFLRTV